MATMMDKILESRKPQSIDTIKAALRLKPEGVVVGEIRQKDTVAAFLDLNSKCPESLLSKIAESTRMTP